MSKIKVKATVFIELDTDEYHIPADLNLRVSLAEDIQEALESNISIQVLETIVNKVQKYDEDFNQA